MPPTRRRTAKKAPPTHDPRLHLPPMVLEALSVLTFDLSKNSTGWAWFDQGQIIDYGAVKVGGDTLSGTMLNAEMVASRLMVGHKLRKADLVVIEEANMQKGMAHRIYEAVYLGFTKTARRYGYDIGIVYNSQVKSAMLAPGKVRGSSKADMIDAARLLYPLPLDRTKESPDGDIADAIGVYVAARTLASRGMLKKGL